MHQYHLIVAMLFLVYKLQETAVQRRQRCFFVCGHLETVHYNSSTSRTDSLQFVKMSASTYIASPEMSCEHHADMLYYILDWCGKLVSKLLPIYTHLQIVAILQSLFFSSDFGLYQFLRERKKYFCCLLRDVCSTVSVMLFLLKQRPAVYKKQRCDSEPNTVRHCELGNQNSVLQS